MGRVETVVPLPGTEGSNPSPSSEESGANLISHYRALPIFAGDRGFESGFLQRGVNCEPDFLTRGSMKPKTNYCG